MNTSMKSQVRAARKARLQELNSLIAEAKKVCFLKENKHLPSYQKKARHFISEYHRLVGAYGALLMLEFYEKGTKETLAILKTIEQGNDENEIGRFLGTLNMGDLVAAMDAISGEETAATTAAGGFKAGKNTAHAGYGSGGYGAVGSGGTYGTMKEDLSEDTIREGLFGFGNKKVEEPYYPQANVVRDASGKNVGQLTPAMQTAKGRASELTKNREQLMDEYQKEMPKVVSFINAYLGLFSDENKAKLKAPKGFFGTSPAAGLAQKEFAKVPGFNAKKLASEVTEDPELVAINIGMATNPSNFEALTSLEDTMQKVQGRALKSFGSRVVDMFSSIGGNPSRMNTMFSRR
jgi:hypothetical protein